ncbi:hypothetical protein IF1G_00456 [Cordyceps javanica]|uniref:Uncharacterized protein n=1 Tax=Cordyceps javanica TaxID=43265 RepID=A0A545VFL6_9HYPO|nr:hypothetical protein IF1G_00456 [Cordyceps javanica]
MARLTDCQMRPVGGGSSLTERIMVHAGVNPSGHTLPGEYTAMEVSHFSPVLMKNANELGKHEGFTRKICPSPGTARHASPTMPFSPPPVFVKEPSSKLQLAGAENVVVRGSAPNWFSQWQQACLLRDLELQLQLFQQLLNRPLAELRWLSQAGSAVSKAECVAWSS